MTQVKHVIRGKRLLNTRHSMAVDTRACGYQQSFGFDGGGAVNRHGVGVHNGGVTSKYGDTAAIKHAVVNALKAVNLGSLVGLPRIHLKLGTLKGPAIGSHLWQLTAKL